MDIQTLVIHCAYTRPSMDIGAETIRRWHVDERGWRDIGYHHIIRRDGTVEAGRAEDQQGAHVAGHNRRSLGICLVGGMLEDDQQPDANFTAAQWAVLETLMRDLKARYPEAEIVGHRDLAPGRACPCFDVKAWASTLSL